MFLHMPIKVNLKWGPTRLMSFNPQSVDVPKVGFIKKIVLTLGINEMTIKTRQPKNLSEGV